jgi:hypothetical protein
MILLGILLVAATGAFTALLIADNLSGGPEYSVTVLGNQIATMNGLAIFLAGIALALTFWLGSALATGGVARARRRSAELREARAVARRAEADRDALQSVRPADGTAASGTVAPPARQRRARHLFGH